MCQYCEQEKNKGAQFCGYCGIDLYYNSENENAGIYVCKNCGEELDSNQQYCPKCGQKKDELSLPSKISNQNSINSADQGSAKKLANTCATGCGFPVGVFLGFAGLFFLIVSFWGLINGMNFISFLFGFVIGLSLFGWGAAIIKSVGFKIKL
ncbi:MAG: zinc ribbon domain-containing protein [Methanomicrobium sp.]|nr:zinc ribbon domain-containing protein [Methanomicrobium sp.]